MPGTFGYTESTNRVVVTGGTSGSPADFASFVTADRAGTDTKLLDAASPGSAVALTYAVRSVEDLAILVKCVVANKTAEADFIFITGTDWRGAAQTESIDVTAGNGSYTSTKYWASITTLDCSDNAAGGGTVWADGDLTVTQDVWGVIWDYGNGQHKVDAVFNIGNGSTSTYFASENEMIVLESGLGAGSFLITSNAELRIGEKSGDWGINGSMWSFSRIENVLGATGVLKIYASKIHGRDAYPFKANTGTIEALNTIFSQRLDIDGSSSRYFKFLCTLTLKDVYFNNLSYPDIRASSPTIDDYHSHACDSGIFAHGTISPVINNAKITSPVSFDVLSSGGANIEARDSSGITGNIAITVADAWIKEIYTCNIHVADKDGGAIANTATVLCTRANVVTESAKFYKCTTAHTSGTFATDLAAGKWEEITDATILAAAPAWLTSTAYVSAEQEFSVNPTSGDIAEQTLTYKKWTGTSELETKYLHTFTLSETGYETLVMQDREIDEPFDCPYELLPALAEADVKYNVSFGENKTGTYMASRKHGRREMG